MTVTAVGEKLRGQYRVGERFIIQADIWKNGVNYAYGYLIPGGFSYYGVIDQRVLNGDHGNYLIPVKPQTGYAESALAEPWACVVAAYMLRYRTTLKPGGTAWFIGTPGAADGYQTSAGFDASSHPGKVLLTRVPPAFAARLKKMAGALGVPVAEADLPQPPGSVDDIVVLGPDADIVEKAAESLREFGILALISDRPLDRPVDVDVGRIHYEQRTYVGTTGRDISLAYSAVPVRSALKPGGKAMFVGAGGPIGRMHVQRAIQTRDGPRLIVCTDPSALRLKDLEESYAAEAAARGITFLCLNPADQKAYQQALAPYRKDGFDDIIVLAPVAAAISASAPLLAPKGVMNVFAGVQKGTLAKVDLSDVCLKQTRVIGHSASSIDDLREVLRLVESGQLSTNRSVAAVGSLSATRDGLKAAQENRFPGKIVIFPHIREFPLTAVPDLKNVLPSVAAKLKHGREWTLEAEEEFLRLTLP